MTIKSSYSPNPGDIVCKRTSRAPTAETIAEYIGQELWWLEGATYYKCTGYSPITGYNWIILQTSSGGGGGGSGLAWTTITTTGTAMQPNSGYYMANTTTPITMTIGTGFVLGSIIQIQCAVGFLGVSIQLSATQSININDLTASSSGTVFASTGGMVIDITCTVADSQFSVSASQVCQVS